MSREVRMASTYDMDALLTSPQAVALFALHGVSISKQAIYRWRTLGRVHAKGHNTQGQPLYRLGDLLTAEQDTRRNPKSSRNLERRSMQLCHV
jgi:hypothetical protein